jgi:transcriptional regulator with XRE-family HTH domain
MLADIRSKKGLSQNELAALSGVSARVIKAYEQGERDINNAKAETIYKLSHALSCRMEDLLDCRKIETKEKAQD